MTTFDYSTTTFRHKLVGHERGRLTVEYHSRFDGVIDVAGKRAQIAILRWCCEQLRVYASAIGAVDCVLHLDALAETVPRDALVNPNDMVEPEPTEPTGELTLVKSEPREQRVGGPRGLTMDIGEPGDWDESEGDA
jgi:hypothetical protein